MKKLLAVVFGVVFALSLFKGVGCAAEMKFGYVDLSRTFSEYSKTKDYDKALTEKENVYSTDRDKKISEIKQLQDKINLLADKDKAAKKPELDSKVKAFQDYDRQKQTDLRKEQDDKMKEILKDIEEAVKAYAAKENFTMVFNDRVLVYQDKSLDITDQIMAILNKGKK